MIGVLVIYFIPGLALAVGGYWVQRGHGPGLTRTLSIIAIVLGVLLMVLSVIIGVFFIPTSFDDGQVDS